MNNDNFFISIKVMIYVNKSIITTIIIENIKSSTKD